jgi:hypothetical protein
MAECTIRLEYDNAEEGWVAVFVRDGEPWIMDGALVGMGTDPASAVENLTGLSMWLIAHGENFLTKGQIDPADRLWLRTLLAPLGDAAGWLARNTRGPLLSRSMRAMWP